MQLNIQLPKRALNTEIPIIIPYSIAAAVNTH
jgi:hypothetical protein